MKLVIDSKQIIVEIIHENGNFPNNEKLPLILYKSALNLAEISPSFIEEVFLSNHWINSWVDSIYTFHHYHSNTHEVLGIASGKVVVEMGGDHGRKFMLEQGDVLIIAAGISHKNISSSSDLKCVGAYPFEIAYNMNYGKAEERPRSDEQIKQVPLPKTDPIYGSKGPLINYWH